MKGRKDDQIDLFGSDNLEQAAALLELNWQFRSSRALMAAHQLGFFEALAKPRQADQVALKCGTDPRMTEKLLIVCCALGVVKRDGERFALTKLGSDVLLQDSPRYIGGTIDHNEILWWATTGLPEVVRTGKRDAAPEPPEHFKQHLFDNWIWAMHGIASNGQAQWVARQIDLSDRKLLLDVAGGPGTYSIALCQRFPHLKAVVWDLPETLVIARQVIQRFGMSKRVKVQAGDWSKDEFGSGYDCLLMSNILHGPGSHADVRLKQAKKALKRGGLLIVHDFLLNNDRSGPLPASLFNLWLGTYTVSEMIAVIRKAGFSDVSLIAGNGQHGSGLITARRP
ncbi:MAG: methyltransferase [Dehalococcoidia bacterium]|jgi:ubiquinone/menaquinone biosynthesis C-methylase UbiE